jgi:hypothetical protein
MQSHEDSEFEASLGWIAKPSFKKKKRKEEMTQNRIINYHMLFFLKEIKIKFVSFVLTE